MPSQPNGIDKAYVTECIFDLAELLPVRPPVAAGKYYGMLAAGQVKECVEAMAADLNLPIHVNVLYVTPEDVGESQFRSRDLVNTDHNGRGTDGITAQVLIPNFLPLYGSDEFRKLTFKVKVSKESVKHQRVFVAIMAHELSHIVLHSLWYRDKENEIKTDLTAMLLGFSDAMKQGRKLIREEVSGNQRTTHTTTYGYLPDDALFDHAYKEIRSLCDAEQRTLHLLQRNIAAVRDGLDHFKKEVTFFEDGLVRLDARGIAKTDPQDGRKLVSFHDVGFLDSYKATAASLKSRFDGISLDGLRPHTKAGAERAQQMEDELGELKRECQRLANDMAENNRIIRKYLGLMERVKFAVFGRR